MKIGSRQVQSPGQKVRNDFPRFGLPEYTEKFPSNIVDRLLEVQVNGQVLPVFDLAASQLPRQTLTADFHCVTTWSYSSARWGGISFVNFFEKHIKPFDTSDNPVTGAVLRAQDGYFTFLLLEDLLTDRVLLADSLEGESLSIEHGAPLRLVAPEHYGYKNIKHFSSIEFYSEMPRVKRGFRAFLDHPRARVRKEERGRWVPGWILRYLYRPLISGTVKDYRNAMDRYIASR